MSEANRGLIQHVWHARYERRNSLRNRFDEYVTGFVDHAFEIASFCPQCRLIEMRAVEVQHTEEGVSGTWQCLNCEHKIEKFVPIEELVEDFNITRGCYRNGNGVPTFEEWRIQLKMKMAKANIPCHEKPDKTIVGKFGTEYREMDLETQKQKYRASLAEPGKEVASA